MCKKISIVIYKKSMAYFPNAIQNTASTGHDEIPYRNILSVREEFAYNISVLDVFVEEFNCMLYII